MTTSSIPIRHLQPFRSVLAGGLVAGALDITYAWVFWTITAGVSAGRIFADHGVLPADGEGHRCRRGHETPRRWPLALGGSGGYLKVMVYSNN